MITYLCWYAPHVVRIYIEIDLRLIFSYQMDKEQPAEESSYVKVELAQPSTSYHLNDTIGEFNDVYYKIDRRNKNTFLWITLQPNVSLYAQYGAMLAMSPELTLKKQLNFSFKEMLIGSTMPQTTYTGPGEVLLARSKW